MRRFVFLLWLVFVSPVLKAKEGMWLPFLLEQMNEKDMRSMGMKIKASDIYDINEGSLKDAVAIFGSGCTAEVISNQGLILTNHHCGYGTVQGLSSVEHNYLTQGFWAKNKQEELPCPGLTVTFIVRIDDVTSQVKQGIQESMDDSVQAKLIQANITQIEKQKKAETGYDALIKSFFSENEYYCFLIEKYSDVRLVGFPPNGIGKFGGDADNWAWPRHTGDFGVFRIYANKDNKPATYSKDNIPFTPRRSFTINIEGVEEHDFTWVYGFPGRTTEYLSSSGVKEVMETIDPIRIAYREKRLAIMKEAMNKDEKTFIQYASKQAGIANYWKKWKGELLGLTKNNAIEKKKQEEVQWMQWVREDASRQQAYGEILSNLDACYQNQQQAVAKNEYYNEGVWACELLKKASLLRDIHEAIDTLNDWTVSDKWVNDLTSFYKQINKETDYTFGKVLLKDALDSMYPDDHLDVESLLNALFHQSVISSEENLKRLLASKDKATIKATLEKDIAYKTFVYFDTDQKNNLVALRASQQKITLLYKKYIQALKEFNEGKPFYPDANATLRVTYGSIESIEAQDGMYYHWQTTLDGAIAKHNPKVQEFTMPQKLIDLYTAKDFGEYSIEKENGEKTVPLAFLATNHTTGGNSGSPVINARGELIGTNFDRIWEGTMSDVMYDINLCRNITLDIRYTLFIIEKFGDAKWLIDEMNIKK